MKVYINKKAGKTFSKVRKERERMNNIEKVANAGRTEFEYGEILVKDMSRLIIDILDYNYACKNYEGNMKAIKQDKIGTISKSLVLLMSDLDVYMYMLGITESVKEKEAARLEKIAKRCKNNIDN